MKRESLPAFRMPNEDSSTLGKRSRAGSGYLPEEPGIRASLTPVSLFRTYHLILESCLETRFFPGINLDYVHVQVSPQTARSWREVPGRGSWAFPPACVPLKATAFTLMFLSHIYEALVCPCGKRG